MKARAISMQHWASERQVINRDGTIDEMIEVGHWPKDDWARAEGNFMAVFGDIEDSGIYLLPSGVRVWMRLGMFERDTGVKVVYFKDAKGKNSNEVSIYPHTAKSVVQMVSSAFQTFEKLFVSGLYPDRIALILRYERRWVRQKPPKTNPNVGKTPDEEDLPF